MRAAALAGQALIPLLRFHALRMAGELALESNLRSKAQTLWREALEVAAAIPPVEADAGGLTASAEELTAAFKQQGFTAGRAGAAEPAEAVS
jgi:hypothetical protein